MGCITPQNPAMPPNALQAIARYIEASNINHDLNVNKKYSYLIKIDPNTTVNEGFKKSYAYECLTTKQELNSKRQEFWETRADGKPECWNALRQVIENQNSQGEDILKKAKVTMLNGNIQMCIDTRYHKYEIPAFLLSEPISYSADVLAERNLNFSYNEASLFNVKIRSAKYPNEDIMMPQLQAKTTIEAIKQKLRVIKNLKAEGIRFFYNGRVLNDARTIGNYGYLNETVIQAMIS